jgi:hypothetical protein
MAGVTSPYDDMPPYITYIGGPGSILDEYSESLAGSIPGQPPMWVPIPQRAPKPYFPVNFGGVTRINPVTKKKEMLWVRPEHHSTWKTFLKIAVPVAVAPFALPLLAKSAAGAVTKVAKVAVKAVKAVPLAKTATVAKSLLPQPETGPFTVPASALIPPATKPDQPAPPKPQDSTMLLALGGVALLLLLKKR